VTSEKKLRLLVEGWRWIPHSYALVNAFQLLELTQRENVEIFIRDIPYPSESWQPTKELLSADEEELLESFQVWNGEDIDAVYRIAFPADLSPPPVSGVPVFVFLTAEYQKFMPDFFVNGTAADIPNLDYLHFITPSKWSQVAFQDYGRPCHVIPHGVDRTKLYRMSDSERSEARGSLKIEDKFVWLNISAMTGNKGLDVLLRAFAQLCMEETQSVLFLKGLNGLYNSDYYLNQWLEVLPEKHRDLVKSRIFCTQASLPYSEVNRLFNLADCYVAPYRAEGFNMPVLESAGCGLPVLVSDGGSTADFINEDVARTIRTTLVENDERTYLDPDVDDLISKMREVRDDASFRERVVTEGPKHVEKSYGWAGIVDQLIAVISKTCR
jgi:glycosyltransferase involved in cell wall biosynthesis